MTSEQTHRLVIAEDHTILREGLKALLGTRPDLEVVGEATDGREAVRAVQELNPDLILLDLSMPRSNGLEALKEIKRLSPPDQGAGPDRAQDRGLRIHGAPGRG